MKIRMALFRKATLVVLAAGFLISASSCASTKSGTPRRNDTSQSFNQASKGGQGGSAQPDRTSQNRVQKSEGMKGPYKPQQESYQQNSRPQGENNHDNGLGNAIFSVIIGLIIALFGGNE
jgi:hypothetical protein